MADDRGHQKQAASGQVLSWSVAVSLDQIIPAEALGTVVQGTVMHDFADYAEEAKEKGSWFLLNLTVPVGKMLDWFIRHFPGEAYATIGEIQRQAHTTWNVPPTDTLRALRRDLSLDGKLTDEQRATYFALLKPHEDVD
ncbi:hypothetical protein [Streptomyces odonnellii]|uniref:hypothetical protein n=1 Tax=Streptomyces odonnellii TaxID=1417980 RepID=UPI000B115FA1|nr:hypothetical protein [Streptomyces odonnellii]